MSGTDDDHAHRSLFAGLRIVSLLTLVSRVLGLLRDTGMAVLFGNGAVLDAFSVAFRLPNLARRIFGEGALTSAFLPIFVREMEQSGKESAWRLASAVLLLLAMLLAGIVFAVELLLWLAVSVFDLTDNAELLVGLTAVMLPYLLLICLAAQISAVLHALGHFTLPALLPAFLNIVWLSTVWLVAPRFASPTTQIYVIAVSIPLAGCLQLLLQCPVLWRFGFRPGGGLRHRPREWIESVRDPLREIRRAVLPILIGISVGQFNSVLDSFIAWGLAAPEGGAAAVISLRPLESGTASALYLGQRMYQFPLGVFGIALGTVLFPLLARHAERDQLQKLRDDLTLGLRLVSCVGLPASAGLVLLARPLTELLFQYGEFNSHDADQTSAMTAVYGCGVWIYCSILLLNRGFYAVGDQRTPMIIGCRTLLINLVLNLTLIWLIGGVGLAVGTVAASAIQLWLIMRSFENRLGKLNRTALMATTLRSIPATVLMCAACLATLTVLPAGEDFTHRLLRVSMSIAASVAVYAGVARLLGMNELWMLLKPGSVTTD